jgi:hypothetical protein
MYFPWPTEIPAQQLKKNPLKTSRATALFRTMELGLWPGRFLAFFFNGFFRWVFLLPRVGAGWANRVNGFGPGRPIGQKIFTGRVTARLKNRVKHTSFLQNLKNSLNFLSSSSNNDTSILCSEHFSTTYPTFHAKFS